MRNFGMALFGGYKKDEVNEYIEHLIDELEELKEKQDDSGQQLKDEVEQLREQITRQEKQLEDQERKLQDQKQKLEDQERQLSAGEQIKQKLEDQVRQLEEQPKEDPQATAKVEELQDKLKEYERRYDSVGRVLSLAEKTVHEAEIEAAGIVTSGKTEVDEYRAQAERDLEKKRKKNEDDFMLAKYKLMNYLKALNDTQNKLVTTYNDLGALVEKLPLRIGDILSEEPFDLLEEPPARQKAEEEPQTRESAERGTE